MASEASPEVVSYLPPEDEWGESSTYTVPLIRDDGTESPNDRLKLRVRNHSQTESIVEFAVVQQTLHRRVWRDVAAADSCHEDEVHLHRYGRRAEGRIGDPVRLCDVDSLEALALGYDVAYDAVVESWAANLGRWHDA